MVCLPSSSQVPAVRRLPHNLPTGWGRLKGPSARSMRARSCCPVRRWRPTGPGHHPRQGCRPGPIWQLSQSMFGPRMLRVHLDDRFVGRARYLDGKPGYLYLEPGTYNLELRLEGYRTVLVELEATPSCRYDLKHRLEKSRSTVPGGSAIDYGKGEALQSGLRAAVTDPSLAVASSLRSGPDPEPEAGSGSPVEHVPPMP